jgi:hypothetical protein
MRFCMYIYFCICMCFLHMCHVKTSTIKEIKHSVILYEPSAVNIWWNCTHIGIFIPEHVLCSALNVDGMMVIKGIHLKCVTPLMVHHIEHKLVLADCIAHICMSRRVWPLWRSVRITSCLWMVLEEKTATLSMWHNEGKHKYQLLEFSHRAELHWQQCQWHHSQGCWHGWTPNKNSTLKLVLKCIGCL